MWPYMSSMGWWMLELGTFLMRSESELVLKSRRVIPSRLLASGFEFQFASWATAAEELCHRWRSLQSLASRGGGSSNLGFDCHGSASRAPGNTADTAVALKIDD